MPPIKVDLSPDRSRAHVSLGGSSAELSAQEIDAAIRDLAAARAMMTPVHPAVVPDDPERVHHGDNLLWSVTAAPARAAIRFALQHPGLGWTEMWLSRAQVEDLQTSFEFELVKIPDSG